MRGMKWVLWGCNCPSGANGIKEVCQNCPSPSLSTTPPIPLWLPSLSTNLEDLIFCPQECVIKTGQIKTSLPLIPYLPPEKPDPS